MFNAEYLKSLETAYPKADVKSLAARMKLKAERDGYESINNWERYLEAACKRQEEEGGHKKSEKPVERHRGTLSGDGGWNPRADSMSDTEAAVRAFAERIKREFLSPSECLPLAAADPVLREALLHFYPDAVYRMWQTGLRFHSWEWPIMAFGSSGQMLRDCILGGRIATNPEAGARWTRACDESEAVRGWESRWIDHEERLTKLLGTENPYVKVILAMRGQPINELAFPEAAEDNGSHDRDAQA